MDTMIGKTRRIPSACLALLLPLVLMACTGESPTEPSGITIADVAFHSYELANSERRDAGVSPQLALDDALAAVARAHSQAMRDNNFFGHNGPNGDLRARLQAAGISYRTAAENLAEVDAGADAAGVAHALLMSSQQHRNNILNSRFKLVGVGVVREGNSWWFTQIFVNP